MVRECRGCDLVEDAPATAGERGHGTGACYCGSEAVAAVCQVWHGPGWDGFKDARSACEALMVAAPYVKAEALREAARKMTPEQGRLPRVYLAERADRIEAHQ